MALTWTGKDALHAELTQLPDALGGEGGKIAEGRANGAALTIKRLYPVRTGKLRDSVKVEFKPGRYGTRVIVRNTSKYAKAFDEGHQTRQTKLGANRGAMPANPLFSQTVARERRAMGQDLIAMLERKGFTVTGSI